MPTNDSGEQRKQRALEALERARAYAEKVRTDYQEFTEGVLAIGTRVLAEGEYPPKKMFSDAMTTALHGASIWASWWMPNTPAAPGEPGPK